MNVGRLNYLIKNDELDRIVKSEEQEFNNLQDRERFSVEQVFHVEEKDNEYTI